MSQKSVTFFLAPPEVSKETKSQGQRIVTMCNQGMHSVSKIPNAYEIIPLLCWFLQSKWPGLEKISGF
jgi:hypothetical protein